MTLGWTKIGKHGEFRVHSACKAVADRPLCTVHFYAHYAFPLHRMLNEAGAECKKERAAGEEKEDETQANTNPPGTCR